MTLSTRHIAIAMLALLAAGAAATVRERTTRRGLRDAAPPAACAEAQEADTLQLPDSIVVAGYDKPLRARREAFFITNNRCDSLLGADVRIDYSDTRGRPLHNRTEHIDCLLAPGETRHFTLPTWDTQGSFYYIRSTPPKRVAATPYSVRFTVTRAMVPARGAR